MNVSLCFFGAFTTPIRAEVALVRLPLTALIGVCLCNVENRIWSTLLQRSPRPRMLRNLCKCILGRIERGMPRGEGCNKQKMQQGKRERKKKYCILLSFILLAAFLSDFPRMHFNKRSTKSVDNDSVICYHYHL